MKHSSVVPDFYGSHEQLAEQIGDLFYDSLAELLGLMADKIRRDAEADRQRGRTKLAQELTTCAEHLSAAVECISRSLGRFASRSWPKPCGNGMGRNFVSLNCRVNV